MLGTNDDTINYRDKNKFSSMINEIDKLDKTDVLNANSISLILLDRRQLKKFAFNKYVMQNICGLLTFNCWLHTT
jgi:hypothetical protein